MCGVAGLSSRREVDMFMIIPSQEGLKKEGSREGETLDEKRGANTELFGPAKEG